MSAAPTPLLERDEQLETMRSRLAGARRGEGGSLVVRGPAGAGKSSLLAALRSEATDLRVLQASGGELEREFAFGIVHQLLDPVVRAASADERARLFAGAASGAAALFGTSEEPAVVGAADVSFAVLHGLYWLVATLAEQEPLLLVVDDLQWSDEPSLRFADFLARRLVELPVLLVTGVRTGERPEADELLIDAPAAWVLEPPPLSLAATGAVIAAAAGDPIDEAAAAAAHESTGGNPLLVIELARTLGSWDGAPTAEVVRAAVPSSVARSVSRRLRRLEPDALRAAQVLAVLGEGVPEPTLAAVAGLTTGAFADAATRLEVIGFTVGHPPRFVHALIRQAIAGDVAAGERGMLHAAAAKALHRVGAPRELVVAHLLAAPPLGEAWAEESLRQAARSAMSEGAADLAVRRLRRALEETDTQPGPAAWLELGSAELAAGDPRSLEHLRAAAGGDDPIAAAALGVLVMVGTGERDLMDFALSRSLELLGRPDADPMLLQAVLNALSFEPAMPAARADMLALAVERDEPGTLAVRALEAAARGEPFERVAAMVAPSFGGDASLGPPGLEGSNAWGAVVAALAIEQPALVDPLLARLEVATRRGSSRIAAYFEAHVRGVTAAATGQLALAEAMLRSALDRCMDLTDRVLSRSSTAELAGVLVRMGRLDEAQALLADVDDESFDGLGFAACTWWTRRAELRAAQTRWPEALADLRRVEARLGAWGWDAFPIGRGAALQARALIETGETAEGVRRAETTLSASRARNHAGLQTAALLALASSSQTPEQGAALTAEAAVVAAGAPDLVLRAEASLAHGIWLRRVGQRKAARTALGEARATASRAGAGSLLASATQEYVVAGGRPQRIAVSGVDALTPSERRTAELAAAGHTNREIAERLFVTRKTVEFTLGRVFQKLDISSRTQLPQHLTSAAPDQTPG